MHLTRTWVAVDPRLILTTLAPTWLVRRTILDRIPWLQPLA